MSASHRKGSAKGRRLHHTISALFTCAAWRRILLANKGDGRGKRKGVRVNSPSSFSLGIGEALSATFASSPAIVSSIGAIR